MTDRLVIAPHSYANPAWPYQPPPNRPEATQSPEIEGDDA